ncbi:Sporulation protein YtfJ (Spore_YtfJ) [uncultured archaeon]|nr:Sporulation protein YtfJ (Spore_YtfJ) [uncultured archaeon]
MDNLAEILQTITGEMQKSLSARTVVAEPIAAEGKTIIPLVSIGAGFGAGSGSGKDQSSSGGSGGGGALGIKPVAVVVIDQEGVRVERLTETKHSLIEHLVESMPRFIESMSRKKEKHIEVEEPHE